MTRQTNILLIDEDLMVRQAIGQVLAIENYRVVSARDQQEALREFTRQPFDQRIDIVLLDLNPRNENASETVRHLTALQRDLPVVAMTARLEQYDSSCTDLAVDAVMEKPLDFVSLMKLLNDLTSPTLKLRRRCKSPHLVAN